MAMKYENWLVDVSGAPTLPVGHQPRQRVLPATAGVRHDLRLMRRIDALHLELPFTGVRMLRDFLRTEDVGGGRKHVATLMRPMGLAALYCKPNTSKKQPGCLVR